MEEFTYNGPSMNPLFRAGDQLRVVPYGNSRVRVGDVVVFFAPEGNLRITHRVVAVDSQGVRTRGDNNDLTDPVILHEGEVIGKVVSIRRGFREVAVFGGRRGWLYAGAVWSRKYLYSVIVIILHPAYRTLASSGICRRLLPRRAMPRILCFNRPDGVEMQLVMGKRLIIGRRRPGWSHWQVRFPFRLFVDEGSLP